MTKDIIENYGICNGVAAGGCLRKTHE